MLDSAKDQKIKIEIYEIEDRFGYFFSVAYNSFVTQFQYKKILCSMVKYINKIRD